MSAGLPRGWHARTLGDICLPIVKIDPATTKRKTIRYVDIGSVDGSNHALVEAATIDAASAPSRARQVIASGDTVFSTVRPYLEKIAYIDQTLDGEFASTGFCVLRPGSELLSRYLYYFATSKELLQQVLPLQRGVSYPAVLDKDVRAAQIPLPSMSEQRRIVEVLEEHLSRLDAAGTEVVSALRGAERFLASSLNGFLRQVQEAKWARLGEIGVKSGYGTSAKCVADGPGPAVVRIPNLVDGKIDMSDEKRVQDPAVDVSALVLDEGDLLFIRTNGSRDLIGRTAVVQPRVDAAFASYLIRYRFDASRVAPEWVHLVMRTPSLRAQLESLAASSAGQYNLSLGKLNQLTLPVPSLSEQHRLISCLAHLDDQFARLRTSIESTSRRQAHLRGALLAAAFSGRLSRQRLDDELIQERAGV